MWLISSRQFWKQSQGSTEVNSSRCPLRAPLNAFKQWRSQWLPAEPLVESDLSATDRAAINEIVTLMTRDLDRQTDPLKQRSQHGKQHGCLWGEVQIESRYLEQLPAYARVGLWQVERTYPAWIRFSNFRERDDSQGDIQGMAIKLMDVEGNRPADSNPMDRTQDLLFINTPQFFTAGIQSYLEFFRVTDGLKQLKYLKQRKHSSTSSKSELPATDAIAALPPISRTQVLRQFLRFLFPSPRPSQWRLQPIWLLLRTKVEKGLHKPNSLLEQAYWTPTPSALGENGAENGAMKLVLKPSVLNRSEKPDYAPDYLRTALRRHLRDRRQPAQFDLCLQLADGGPNTPLNDPTVRWTDIADYKVGTVSIPPQDFEQPAQTQFGENLSFTPWHCLQAHQPLGAIDLIRKAVYERTATLRQQHNQTAGVNPLAPVVHGEPSAETFQPATLAPQAPQGVAQPLTVLVPVKPEAVEQLQQVLQQVEDSINQPLGSDRFFSKSPSTHFARWVFFADPSPQDPTLQIQPNLLFTSNHDGSLAAYLAELVATLGPEMDPIWSCCEGYQPQDSLDLERFAAFIQSYSYPTHAFYIGCRGASAKAIQQGQTTRASLDQFLAENPTLTEQLGALGEPGASLAATTTPPLPKWIQRLAKPAKRLGKRLFFVVSIREQLNQPQERISVTPEDELRLATCQDREDHQYVNPMTVMSPIKSDFHCWFLGLVLWLVNQVSKQGRGTLSGIPSIHFARWVILKKGVLNPHTHFLLFESNYGGSWDNYLDDFAYRTLIPMNLIWGNLRGFPRGGCRDIELFKRHQRTRQFPTQVFYCAYPELSMENVLSDRHLQSSLTALTHYIQGTYTPLSHHEDHRLMTLVKQSSGSD
jgi:hypothetical protein